MINNTINAFKNYENILNSYDVSNEFGYEAFAYEKINEDCFKIIKTLYNFNNDIIDNFI